MASIPESLFSWQAVESSSEICRFHCILEAIDDEPLMRHLEADRKGRRNDNPIRAMWNSLLAGLVFQHGTIESLRRELMRNGELRQACGFEVVPITIVVDGKQTLRDPTPSKDAYSRFLDKLAEHEDLLLGIFASLVDRLFESLPEFGKHLAADGKAIPAARKDDLDAAVGEKKQGCPDGEEGGETTYQWFGYKLHMVCDAKTELPVGFEVTNAAEHESPHLIGLVEDIRRRHEPLLERAETLCADKGYDDGADKADLFDEYGVAAVIPSRDLKQGRMEPLDPTGHDTIYLSPTGQVSCKIRPFEQTPERQFAPMQFMGFEKDRSGLKFRCPAAAYGIECQNRDACACSWKAKYGSWGRVVRVRLDRDRRILGPVYEHSYRFEDLYRMRTSVERLFFRLDHMFGFERHNTVGLKRMKTRVTLAMIAMQAVAVGWIAAGQADRIRSLRPAA